MVNYKFAIIEKLRNFIKGENKSITIINNNDKMTATIPTIEILLPSWFVSNDISLTDSERNETLIRVIKKSDKRRNYYTTTDGRDISEIDLQNNYVIWKAFANENHYKETKEKQDKLFNGIPVFDANEKNNIAEVQIHQTSNEEIIHQTEQQKPIEKTIIQPTQIQQSNFDLSVLEKVKIDFINKKNVEMNQEIVEKQVIKLELPFVFEYDVKKLNQLISILDLDIDTIFDAISRNINIEEIILNAKTILKEITLNGIENYTSLTYDNSKIKAMQKEYSNLMNELNESRSNNLLVLQEKATIENHYKNLVLEYQKCLSRIDEMQIALDNATTIQPVIENKNIEIIDESILSNDTIIQKFREKYNK